MAHESGSFDYKIINENIRKILDVRSQLNNTVQVGMPFVKATTTLRHDDYLGSGNKGFTLGLHGINEDVKYEDIYSDQNGMDPLIGYTYQENGLTKRVYAKNPMTEVYKTAGQILDVQASVFTYPKDSNFLRTPPPGITNLTVGRNKNGLLSVAELQISIPSLLQLESLHRTFLIPGIGMVVEWGQQFSPYVTNDQFLQKSDITEYMFPWHDRSKLDPILELLAKRQVGLMEILEKYTYPSNGQYMWMFGRVGTFDVKSNSDGSFTSNVKIVGSSEDAWAYSTRNTVVPKKDAGSQYYCTSDTNSVYSYFANSVAGGGTNLKSLLDDVLHGKGAAGAWKDHVIYFEQGNQTRGEPEPNTQTPTADNRTFADHEEAYFMTWRFFVNVVINNADVGVKSVFSAAGLGKEVIDSIGLLLEYGNGEGRDTNVAKLKVIDDPKESYVGVNKYLRSIDPSIMIIVNEKAAELANNNPQYNIPISERDLLNPTDQSNKFKIPTVPFEQSAQVEDANNPDKGFLSSGVWINHKAVVEAMLSADTILRGISNLLELMNQATSNYWQLTLDTIDGEENKNPQSYTVIDANWRDSSNEAVKKFLNNVHIFNKYIRNKSGELVGSELIECSVDLSLPKRLFSQIATLGLLSTEDIQNINKKELKVGDPVPEKKDDDSVSAKIEPNNTLAEMFGVISLSSRDKEGRGPDLTILPNNQSGNTTRTCGKTNAQLVAGIGGQGYQVANVNPIESVLSSPSEFKKQLDESRAIVSSSVCQQCAPCIEAENRKFNQEISIQDGITLTRDNTAQFTGLDLSLQIGDKVSIGLLQEVNSVFASLGIKGRVSSAQRSPGYSEQVKNSRHISGAAIDIDAVFVNGRFYSVQRSTNAEYTGDAKQAAVLLDLVKNKLIGLGYVESEGQNKKSVLWKTEEHFDHIHISKLFDQTTPPSPTTTPAPTTPSSEPQICTDKDYQRIGGGNAAEGVKKCSECRKNNDIVKQITESTQNSVDVAIRKFSGLRQAFRYVEIFPEMMVASIASTADGNRSNAFGASPGSLSISADMVLPGINGLRIGELFWIDRVPAFYKVFGAFQILSLQDTIDINGWKTKIHARFNYLGTAWKKSMAEILKPR